MNRSHINSYNIFPEIVGSSKVQSNLLFLGKFFVISVEICEKEFCVRVKKFPSDFQVGHANLPCLPCLFKETIV